MGARNKVTHLSDNMRQAIQLLILDRWGQGNVSRHVCQTLQIAPQTLQSWRRSRVFRNEFKKQLELYRQNFEEFQMADRKERVRAMNDLYFKIPDRQVSLKLKVLGAIRSEVGDDKVVQHKHSLVKAQSAGPNVPPRATDYKDWLTQNQQAVEAEAVTVTPVTEPTKPPKELTDGRKEDPEEEGITEEGSGEEDIEPFDDPLNFLSI